MTAAKLDEINAALRHRYPYLRADAINRAATRAYLAASSPYEFRHLAPDWNDRPRHEAWLEGCPAEQIVDSIDLVAMRATPRPPREMPLSGQDVPHEREKAGVQIVERCALAPQGRKLVDKLERQVVADVRLHGRRSS